jgi:hypothetical protein
MPAVCNACGDAILVDSGMLCLFLVREKDEQGRIQLFSGKRR